MSKAIVLLSGGQDSTTSLHWAKQNYDELLALSIFYGQRHRSEVQAAAHIAALVGCDHIVLEAPVLATLADSALVDESKELVGSGGYEDHALGGPGASGLPTSFVPGRNILFLTLAAAVAVKHGCRDIIVGVCQTDHAGYPDCRRSFMVEMERAITAGMPTGVGPFRIITPLIYLTKAETVRMAHRLGSECWEALGMSVTCYLGQRPGCGQCSACRLRAAGFLKAGMTDPASQRTLV